ETEEGPRLDPGFAVHHGDGLTVTVHVAQQAAYVFGGQVGLECPGSVSVAEGHHAVGQAAQHHALVRHGVVRLERLAVDGD
nr:hypothetical protein [Tanacetum cinerariifolium]